MNSLLIYPIALPLAAGLICLLLPRRARYVREILCLGVSIATLAAAISIYQQGALKFQMNWFAVAPYLQVSIDLLATPLAKLGNHRRRHLRHLDLHLLVGIHAR